MCTSVFPEVRQERTHQAHDRGEAVNTGARRTPSRTKHIEYVPCIQETEYIPEGELKFAEERCIDLNRREVDPTQNQCDRRDQVGYPELGDQSRRDLCTLLFSGRHGSFGLFLGEL